MSQTERVYLVDLAEHERDLPRAQWRTRHAAGILVVAGARFATYPDGDPRPIDPADHPYRYKVLVPGNTTNAFLVEVMIEHEGMTIAEFPLD